MNSLFLVKHNSCAEYFCLGIYIPLLVIVNLVDSGSIWGTKPSTPTSTKFIDVSQQLLINSRNVAANDSRGIVPVPVLANVMLHAAGIVHNLKRMHENKVVPGGH